ncbi:pyrroline-5-carboxylate reductase [Tissierella creatinini]|nr:pyrroline-5-carboxylate reductase [Tissierella creatinini]TJX66130.1 pyrroline-5-carboxylate reductase [Soehngenia saccharolytica]
MNKKIGFIGTGNMSTTIIRGLVGNFEGINKSIYVSNRSREKAEKLCNELDINLSEDNIDLVKTCDVVFLGIKPFIYDKVLSEISSHITEDKLIVSLAAGVSMEDVGGYFNNPTKIIRIMPNVAVNVGEGMIALSFNDNVSIDETDFIVNLLSTIALVDRIEENLMDAVTTISGCGPAFIAMFVEALADGSVLYGMPRDKAYIYAAQTLIGTGKMMLEKKIHPGQIKDMVSSPKGVTIEGVYALEKRGFRNILMETIEACNKKMQK